MKKVNLLGLAFALAFCSALVMGQDNSGRPLIASMTGAAEVPVPGDPDGTGTAWIRLNQGQSQICFEIRVANIVLPATAAHIHPGAAGQANPPIVNLAPPNAQGFSAGCINNVPEQLIKDIRQNPQNFYVNVHNAQYPGGAVRGQLFKPE
jgi:hypothetical protein